MENSLGNTILQLLPTFPHENPVPLPRGMDGRAALLKCLSRWSMQQYINALSRILREILAAGSARDWDKLIELAKELEELARAGRNENPDENHDR